MSGIQVDPDWLLKFDHLRSRRKWTAVGPDGRLGDVETVDEAIQLLRNAGAPQFIPFMDVRPDPSNTER